ncbi:MAG TPA: response regulator [Pyrinomonadaceae bacterium]|nr:response regulator [Pyrinomonadaceae bacterium]
MTMEENVMQRQTFKKTYMLLIIAAAAASVLYSASHFPLERLDLQFLALAIFTVAVSSRLTIRIPRISGHISVSDTFFFLTILLYGGEAAVVLAAIEALCSSLRFSNKAIHIKPLTIAFNSAMMACSTFATFVVVTFLFGDTTTLRQGQFSGRFVAALCVMALVQYGSNSLLAAIYTSLKAGDSIWHTWTKYYLWASITYFAGASAAGITAKMADTAGFYAILATTPIVAIVYLTYRTYLRNIEVMAAAAKAEEVAAHAEEAERHVAELNHYITEQDRIRQQFSQIEKMSALGELASGVAHDFNNTLAGILGRAQLLLETNDPRKIESGLNIIIKTAKDGAKTVKRIQDFARQRRDHDFQLVDVRQLLLDVGEITRPRWKNRAEAANIHITLDLECPGGLLIMGDESEMREVLVNLVFNAVDAMPHGGTLALSAQKANDAVEISVRDTGTGMTEEIRLRVFDPFFTTKDQLGMGLGLAVSYGIIRRHEGTVDVESQIGAGTVFRIRLPIPQSGQTTNIVHNFTAATLTRFNSFQTRILVVDDEEYVRDLLRDILEKEGCRVTIADGGRQALTLFDKGNFDAVFTDVGMPDMNGWELSRAVRQRDPRIPVAVITGWGEAVGSYERQAAQVDWVVTKPFDRSQIVEMAQEVLRRRDPARRAEVAAVAA